MKQREEEVFPRGICFCVKGRVNMLIQVLLSQQQTCNQIQWFKVELKNLIFAFHLFMLTATTLFPTNNFR